VRVPLDDLRTLKRRARELGVKPATYARILLLEALRTENPKPKAKR
jgi:hypothetical protein